MTSPITIRPREEPLLQAWLVTADNLAEVAAWAGGGYWPKEVEPIVWLRQDSSQPPDQADIKVEPGEYVVRGITGNFFRTTADEMAATYEEIKP